MSIEMDKVVVMMAGTLSGILLGLGATLLGVAGANKYRHEKFVITLPKVSDRAVLQTNSNTGTGSEDENKKQESQSQSKEVVAQSKEITVVNGDVASKQEPNENKPNENKQSPDLAANQGDQNKQTVQTGQ